jgi:DnaJ-class molecular chaperone
MKVGFGGKGKKKKGGGKKGGGKQKGGKGGDADMADAAGAQPASGGGGGGGGGAPQSTAKEKQRNRMELKRALKVRVAGLKAHRYGGARAGGASCRAGAGAAKGQAMSLWGKRAGGGAHQAWHLFWQGRSLCPPCKLDKRQLCYL